MPSPRVRARITARFRLSESVTVRARAYDGTNWSALNEADFTVIQTFKELLVTEIMSQSSGAEWD